MSAIVLATLNAKYIHASMGLRCLLANMDKHGAPGLREQTRLMEFVIGQRPVEMVEALLGKDPAAEPRVVGFGVYIWNAVETESVVRLLKALRPHIKVILGGPEVSHEIEQQSLCAAADHIVTGWGDVSFPKLCATLIHGSPTQRAVLAKVITGEQPPLDELAMPYAEYTDADLKNRLLYVEASRGCPFKCEFCLSSLDKTAWAFDLEAFLAHMQSLYDRGARHFKFVDRTFNLKIDTSAQILQFFLDRMSADLFVHFEVVPDNLPDRLKQLIAQFPPGALQFEVGIQSLNPEVQQRISRKQDAAKTEANVRWLMTQSHAHLHTDLIFGLPGESLQSFAQGFDELVRWRPHEVQFGILKRLRGTPIIRHTGEHSMVYDPEPPYTVMQTDAVDFATMLRVQRMARYWDMVANSGRYPLTVELLLDTDNPAASPFMNFLAFSDWLWATTGKTHEFALEKMVDLLFDHLSAEPRAVHADAARQALLADYTATRARGKPKCLEGLVDTRFKPTDVEARSGAKRQARHIQPAENALKDEIQKAAAAA
jgi:radical SAM superfamily enzyme YgiQ (UPF0313 family)